MTDFSKTFALFNDEDEKKEPSLVQDEPIREAVQAPTFEPVTDSSFGKTWDKINQDQDSKLNSSLGEGVKVNPDQHTQVVKTAQELNVPASFVADDPEGYAASQNAKKVRAKVNQKTNPLTAAYMADYDNAAQFHDDIDTFNGLEDVAKKKWWEYQEDIEQTTDAEEPTRLDRFIENDIANLIKGFGGRVGVGAVKTAAGFIESWNRLKLKHIPEGQEADFDEFVLGGTERTEELTTQMFKQADDVYKEIMTQHPIETKAGEVIGNTLDSIAQQVPGLAVSTLTGNPMLGLAVLGSQTGAQSFIDGKQRGLSDADAFANAGIQAAAEMGTEMIPFIKLGGMIGPGRKFTKDAVQFMLAEFPGEAIATAIQTSSDTYFHEKDPELRQQAMQNYLNGFFVEGSRFRQDQVDTFLQTLVQTTLMAGGAKVIQTGVEKLTGEDQMKVIRAEIQAEVDRQNKSVGEQARIKEIVDITTDSNAVARNPEAVNKFMQDATEEDDAVYIPARVIQQYAEDNEIDLASDPAFAAVAEQMDEALALDADVIIPIGDFAAHLAPTPHYEALKDDLRLSSDSYTPNEAKDQDSENFAQKLREEAEKDADGFLEAQTIYEDVKDQLFDTGRMTESNAKLTASIIPAWATVKAKQTGKSVTEVYEAAALTIKGPLAEEQADQAERARALEEGVQFEQAPIERYKEAPETVSDLTVRSGPVPNEDSISASFNEFTILPDIREIPFSDFSGPDPVTPRVKELAEEIETSGEIAPLIVVIDEDGPYILEGAHRYDALQLIGKETFPALVVIDEDVHREQAEVFRQEPVQTDTEEFKKWAGERVQIIDSNEINDFDFMKEEGPFVVRVFHGTTHELEDFDATRGNIESQFGQVNYFSSSEQDATDNYTGEGPDLTNRIEQRKDQLFNEIDSLGDDTATLVEEFGVSEEEASAIAESDTDVIDAVSERLARKELTGGLPEGQTLELFVRFEKPFSIGDQSFVELFDFEGVDSQAVARVADDQDISAEEVEENRDEYEDQIDEARWEIEEEEQNPLIEAVQTVASRNNVEPSELFGQIADLGESATPGQIESMLRESEDLLYAEGEEGELINSHLIAEIIEEMGFDAIILKDADDRFKTMNIEPHTSHIHVFDADKTNIKSATENIGTFDPTDPNIFRQSTEARGYFDSDQNLIRLSEASDLSTFLHESAHFFLEMEKKLNPEGMGAINDWFKRNAESVADEANKELAHKGFTPEMLEQESVIRKPRTNEFREFHKFSRVKQPVYHATIADFVAFDTSLSDLGAHFGTKEQTENISKRRLAGRGDVKILPVFINIENPLRLKDVGTFHADGIAIQLEKKGLLPKGEGKRIEKEIDENFRLRKKYDPVVRDAIKKAGFDGVVYKNTAEGEGPGDSYIVFEPTQIKSATENIGTFDPTDPNIFRQSEEGVEDEAPPIVTEGLVNQWLDSGTTGDVNIDAAINRATHEQFARGFERYLEEGTAPSVELRDAFRAFARWLRDLWRRMKQTPQANIDEEMRKTFDAMLATEEQIAAAEAADRMRPLFTDAAMAGMTQAEYEKYLERQQKANDKANETLLSKVIKQLKRETKAWWTDEIAERTVNITEELAKQKVYAAMAILRDKEGVVKLDRAEVKELLNVKATPPNFRNMTLTGKEGVGLDDAAAFLGFDSGQEMVKAIDDARPIKEVAKEQAEAEMKAEHGDILNDGTIEQEAQIAVHNEERGRQMLVELKALARKRNVPSVDRATIKQLAKENIARLPLRKIQPHKYRRAEINAAMAAQAAMDAGDTVAALQAKTQQAMNFYLWREATEARETGERIVRFTKKFNKKSVRTKLAKAGNEYLEQIDKILARFNFTASLRAVQKASPINEWAAARAEDGDNIQLVAEVLNPEFVMHYKEVPYQTLLGVFDSIKNLDHVARFTNQVRLEGELLDFQELKRDVLEHLDKVEDVFETPGRIAVAEKTWAQRFRKELSQMTKLPMLFTWLDGGKRIGMIHQLLAQPFTDAAFERQRIYQEVGKVIADAIKNRSKEDIKRHNEKVTIPAIDDTMFRHQLLSVALNAGNRSNLEKMLKGEGWIPEDATDDQITINNPQLQAVFAELTESDWDMVELIWKQINILFPKMAEVHKRTSGVNLPKIEGAGFEVVVNGETRKVTGGYYPMKYDPKRSARAEENEKKAQAAVDSLFGDNGMLKPNANTGAKIERVAFTAPVRFSLDVVTNHVDEVIQYITHYEAIQQVYKISRDPEITAAIKRKVGDEEYNQILPWLNAIAKEGKETSFKEMGESLMGRLRHGMTIGMMGFKASTGLMQISGLSNTVAELGVGYTLRGLRHVSMGLDPNEVDSYEAMWSFVTERSKIMGDRINTMDRDLRDAFKKLQKKSGLVGKAQEVSMKHIAYIQTFAVDLPTWYGAYYKGMDEARAELQMDNYESYEAYSEALEKKAIARADWTVENVQGSGMTKDMAKIMRSQSEFYRMFTMFFSFFSAMWNMQRDAKRSIQKKFKDGDLRGAATTTAATFVFIYAIPVAYEMLLRGGFPEDWEEWKDRAEEYLTKLAVYPAQTVPFVRDAVNALADDFDFQMTPIQSIMKKGLQASESVIEAVMTEKEIKAHHARNMSKLIGALVGVPGVSQTWATGEHLYDVIEEGEELTTRELLFGPEFKGR